MIRVMGRVLFFFYYLIENKRLKEGSNSSLKNLEYFTIQITGDADVRALELLKAAVIVKASVRVAGAHQ